MNSRLVTALVIFGGLALAGVGLRPLGLKANAGRGFQELALPQRQEGVLSESAMVGELLGGFRAVAADLLWLEAHQAAEERNLPATETLLCLASAVDPRPLYFWLNGARIMAYDMPVWRIAAAGGVGRVPVALERRVAREQALRGLRFLDEARSVHPASAAWWIERANIQLNRLGDVAGAAESYRRAAALPDAPYFAARLHAELLRRLGRKKEALAWLVRLHPQLPPDDEAAGTDLVLARIRQLERELGVTAEQAYDGL